MVESSIVQRRYSDFNRRAAEQIAASHAVLASDSRLARRLRGREGSSDGMMTVGGGPGSRPEACQNLKAGPGSPPGARSCRRRVLPGAEVDFPAETGRRALAGKIWWPDVCLAPAVGIAGIAPNSEPGSCEGAVRSGMGGAGTSNGRRVQWVITRCSVCLGRFRIW
jgi:hypothetical protein